MTDKRVTREQWLRGALDFILEQGVFGMTPERLAKSLGTSRSSYYWHFGNRQEFRKQVVDYWIQRYTDVVAEELANFDGPPEDRFDLLIELICDSDITKYEGAVRALAYGDAGLIRKIERAYRFRQESLTSILSDIGVEEGRLAVLSRLILCFFTWETEMGYSRTRQMVEEHRRLVHDLLGTTASKHAN